MEFKKGKTIAAGVMIGTLSLGPVAMADSTNWPFKTVQRTELKTPINADNGIQIKSIEVMTQRMDYGPGKAQTCDLAIYVITDKGLRLPKGLPDNDPMKLRLFLDNGMVTPMGSLMPLVDQIVEHGALTLKDMREDCGVSIPVPNISAIKYRNNAYRIDGKTGTFWLDMAVVQNASVFINKNTDSQKVFVFRLHLDHTYQGFLDGQDFLGDRYKYGVLREGNKEYFIQPPNSTNGFLGQPMSWAITENKVLIDSPDSIKLAIKEAARQQGMSPAAFNYQVALGINAITGLGLELPPRPPDGEFGLKR